MASRGKSRWADTEEDPELQARLIQEKEEKRRKKAEKAEKARRAETERQAAIAASSPQANVDDHGDHDDGRPSKRRRVAHEAGTGSPQRDGSTGDSKAATRLLRFEHAASWAKCRSVENYDKLNDIEEGTYGWVARGTERSTGKVVALKRLKLEPSDRNGLPVTGLREIQILQDCKHRNIVALEEVVVGDHVAKPDK